MPKILVAGGSGHRNSGDSALFGAICDDHNTWFRRFRNIPPYINLHNQQPISVSGYPQSSIRAGRREKRNPGGRLRTGLLCQHQKTLHL